MALSQERRRWANDGNIILIANQKNRSHKEIELLFRVHTALLARSSRVFRAMLGTMSQAGDAETLHGCPVMRLQDPGTDVEMFMDTLYDGYSNRGMGHIQSLLRMASKYEAAYVKDCCIQVLWNRWPPDYGKYRAVQQTLNAGFPRIREAVEVIKACTEFDIPDLLPAAFFELSAGLIRLWSNQECASLEACRPDDLRRAIVGRDRQKSRLRRFITVYQLEPLVFRGDVMGFPTGPHPGCLRSEASDESQKSCPERIREALLSKQNPYVSQVWLLHKIDYNALVTNDGACDVCTRHCMETVEKMRRELWDNLTKDFDMKEPDVINF